MMTTLQSTFVILLIAVLLPICVSAGIPIEIGTRCDTNDIARAWPSNSVYVSYRNVIRTNGTIKTVYDRIVVDKKGTNPGWGNGHTIDYVQPLLQIHRLSEGTNRYGRIWGIEHFVRYGKGDFPPEFYRKHGFRRLTCEDAARLAPEQFWEGASMHHIRMKWGPDDQRSLIYCFGTDELFGTNALISITIYDPKITNGLIEPSEPIFKPAVVDLGAMSRRPRVTTSVTDFDTWIAENKTMLEKGRPGHLYRSATNLYNRVTNPWPEAVASFTLIERFAGKQPINNCIYRFSIINECNIYLSADAAIRFETLCDPYLGAFIYERHSRTFINRVFAPWIRTVTMPRETEPVPISLETYKEKRSMRILSKTKNGKRILAIRYGTYLLYDQDRLSYLMQSQDGVRDDWTEPLLDLLVLSGELPDLIFRKNEIVPWRSF